MFIFGRTPQWIPAVDRRLEVALRGTLLLQEQSNFAGELFAQCHSTARRLDGQQLSAETSWRAMGTQDTQGVGV